MPANSASELQIIAKLNSGITPEATAKIFDITLSEVHSVCDRAEKAGALRLADSRLSGEKRKERRKEIAKAVKSGRSIGDVAKEFGVSRVTAVNACHEFGIELNSDESPARSMKPKTFEMLAALIAAEESDTAIAERFGVSRQLVHQTRKRAQTAGVFAAIEKRVKAGM